ncbi:MAG: porin [Holosporaceae bacterium]|jgi:hypothetical protein|nr:porin [Holosporaceae bacterium]
MKRIFFHLIFTSALSLLNIANVDFCCAADHVADIALLKQQIELLQQKISALEKSCIKPEQQARSVQLPQLQQKSFLSALAKVPQVATVPQADKPIDDGNYLGKVPDSKISGSANDKVAAKTNFVIPGLNTTISLSGFIDLCGIYDLEGTTGGIIDTNGEGAYYSNLRTLATNPTSTTNGNFFFHARASRLAVASKTPIDGKHDLSICLDVDFLGDPSSSPLITNGYLPRLRHAYANLYGFTIGQANSTFTDLVTYGETVDFGGPVGHCQIRQPLIRYKMNPCCSTTLEFSIENPDSEFLTPNLYMLSTSLAKLKEPLKENLKGENRFPDLAAAASYDKDDLYLRLTGLMRINSVCRVVNGNSETFNAMGFALALNLRYKIFKHDEFLGKISYGSGAGRYFTDIYCMATYFDEHGKLHSNKALQLFAGYKHMWNENHKIKSSVIFAYLKNYNCSALRNKIAESGINDAELNKRIDLVNKAIMSFHANLSGNLTDNVTVSIEYMFGKRWTEANRTGILQRITFGCKILF